MPKKLLELMRTKPVCFFVTFIHLLLIEGKELYTTGRIEVIFGAPRPMFSVHKSNSPTSAAAYAV